MENIDRPRSIETALKLGYASLVLGIPKMVLDWNKTPASAPFKILVLAFTFGLIIFLLNKLGKRRNWARITFLVLYILGFPAIFFILKSPFAPGILSGTIGIAQFLLQTAFLIMAFNSSSNAWFRSKQNADA